MKTPLKWQWGSASSIPDLEETARHAAGCALPSGHALRLDQVNYEGWKEGEPVARRALREAMICLAHYSQAPKIAMSTPNTPASA